MASPPVTIPGHGSAGGTAERGGRDTRSRAGGVQPAGWDANVKLTEATDLNPDPQVVEINLEARLADR